MKVAIVTPACYQSTGGPTKSIRAFQRALDARVVAWEEPAHSRDEAPVLEASALVRGTNFPILGKLLYPRRHDLRMANDLAADADLLSVHLCWRWHNRWAHQQADRRGIACWLVPHGGLDPYVFRTQGWAKRIFASTVARRFLLSASGVVCSTSREYQKARRHVPRSRPFILPWPLDPDDFRHRDSVPRGLVRQRLGIPDGAFCLIFLGRLHPMKRPLETIQAVASCGDSNVHLIIVGNPYGVSLDHCEAMAERLGIRERVHLVGPAYGPTKRDYFDAADAFISLSHRENFNFAAVEALASGLPVILSPGNDLAADLEDVDCGWMLPRVDSAVEAICAAAKTSPRALEEIGARGRDWAERHLQFDAFRAQLREYAAACIDDSRSRRDR